MNLDLYSMLDMKKNCGRKKPIVYCKGKDGTQIQNIKDEGTVITQYPACELRTEIVSLM